MRFLKFAHLEHFHHLFLVAKKQDTSIFARHTLNLSDDRVDDCRLVRVMRATSTAFPATAIQTVRLREWSARIRVGCGFDTCLIDNQNFAHGGVQDGLGILLRFTKRTSHKICWVLDNNCDHNVRNQTPVSGRGYLPSPLLTRPRSAKI